MVNSWGSNITNKHQESQGIEIIRSIFHSININQHQVPNSLTLSELKPEKTFNDIVSHVSNPLEFNSNPLKNKFSYKNSNFINNSEKKNFKSSTKKKINPVFYHSYESDDTKSSTNESTEPNISSDKINLLWINCPEKFKSSNDKIYETAHGNKNSTKASSIPFNQRRLEEIRQYVENILAQDGNKSASKLGKLNDESAVVDANQHKNNEKYQINLSFNNYYQPPDKSKGFKDSDEEIKQRSFYPPKINRQKTFCKNENAETNSKLNWKIDKTVKSKDDLDAINNLSNSGYNEHVKRRQLKASDDLVEKRKNNLNLKLNPAKNKLSAVLTGQFKTTAKPSKMLIPQNSRGRALFQSFMHMNDLPEQQEIAIKNKNLNDGGSKFKSSLENSNSRKLIKDPKNKNRKISPDLKLHSNKMSPRPQGFSQKEKSTKIKNLNPEKITQPTPGLLRSKTFVMENKLNLSSDKDKVKDVSEKSFKNEGNDAKDNESSKYLLIVEEIPSEEDNSPDRIEINKTFKNNSNIKLNELIKKNLISSNSEVFNLLDDNEEINIENELNKIKKVLSPKDDKLNKMDTFTETEFSNQLNACTETDDLISQLDKANAETETDLIYRDHKSTSVDGEIFADNFSSLIASKRLLSQTFIDAEVFCNIPIIDTIREESAEDSVDACGVDTQTSEILLREYFRKERKDVSVGTKKIKLKCKHVNTEQVFLIDTATGRDRLNVQNFNCDSQSINTDNLEEIFSDDFRLLRNDAECQVDKLNSFISMDFDKTSTESVKSCDQVVSNFSNQLISSQKSLLECTSKFSDYDLVRCGSLDEIPVEVIKAFKMATERAQNLYEAYKIYQEFQLNKQESNYDSQEEITENLHEENLLISRSNCEEIKSELNHLLEKKIFYYKIKEEIKFIVEIILDKAEEEIIRFENNKLISREDKKNFKRSAASSSSINQHKNFLMQSIISRKNILTIFYAALCSFIFWSLKFSDYYEMN